MQCFFNSLKMILKQLTIGLIKFAKPLATTNRFFHLSTSEFAKLDFINSNRMRNLKLRAFATNNHDNITSIQIKKRPIRKKKTLEVERTGLYNVVAFATCEEYDLDELMKGLKAQDLYEPKLIENTEVKKYNKIF